MRQNLICIFILLLFVENSNAQSKFNVGITAGGGLTGWYDNSDNEYLGDTRTIKHQFTPGFTIGFFSEYKLLKRITLNSEILYLKSGSKHIDKSVDEIYLQTGRPFLRITEIKYRVHNIQIPISLSVGLTKSKYNPFFKFGAVSNYIINGNREYYYHLSTSNETVNTVEDLIFNKDRNQELKFEIKPFIGLGMQLNDRITLESNLSIGYQFHYSFVDNDFVCPEFYQCNVGELSYHNRALLFMLKYKLN